MIPITVCEIMKLVIDKGEEEVDVAKSNMVIMVSGLFTKLQFAYAHFPCATVCGYHMYDIFWEAVECLERRELIVGSCMYILCFTYLTAKSFNTETKDTILYRIISSEDFLFQWSLLSASVDEITGH